MTPRPDRPSQRPWTAPVAALRRLLAGLWQNRRGNVLIIAAFALIPLTFATGMAVDYSRAARLGTKLDAAADAASLSAVANPMLNQSIQASCNAARRTFLNSLQQYNNGLTFNTASDLKISVTETYPSSPDVTLACPTSDATVPSTFTLPTTRVATVTYTGLSANAFGGVLGASTISIGGTATAKGAPITYIDYYVLLDISQSMGIASTTSDMQALFNRTQTYNGSGCVFGCHVAQGGSYANEYLAHSMSPRINLRIDAAVSAIQTMITDAQSAAGTYKNIRIGIYTMNIDPTNGQTMTVVSAPTSDYATLMTKVAAITLGNNTSAGIGDTNYVTSGTQFYNSVPANGNGLSASSPKNYAFLVADGVNDTPGSSCTSGHCTSVIDPSNCTYFKQKASVGVIYTTYLPIYNNNNASNGYQINYQQLVLPFQSQIEPAMQKCASDSSLYYRADDGPAIDASMKNLFTSTLKSARLSQ